MGIFTDFFNQTKLLDTNPYREGNHRIIWNDIQNLYEMHGDVDYPAGFEDRPALSILHIMGIVGTVIPDTGDIEPLEITFDRETNKYMALEATIRLLISQAAIEDNNPPLEDEILRLIRYIPGNHVTVTDVKDPGLQTDPGMPIYGLFNREFTTWTPRYHQNDYQPNQYDTDGALRYYEVSGPSSNSGSLLTFDSNNGNLGRCAKFDLGEYYTAYTDYLNKKSQTAPVPDGGPLEPFHNTWWFLWDTVPTSELRLCEQAVTHPTYGYRDYFTFGYSPTLSGYFLRSHSVDPYPAGAPVELVVPAQPAVGEWFMLESWMTDSGTLHFAVDGGEPVSVPLPGGMLVPSVPMVLGKGDMKTTGWNFWHRVLEKNERRFVYNNGLGYKWEAWNCRPQMYIVKTQSTIVQGNGVNMTNHWAWSITDDVDNRVGDPRESDQCTLEIDWTDTDAAPGAFRYIFRGDPDITVVEGESRTDMYNGERRVIKGKLTDMQAYQAGAFLTNLSAAEDEYANMVCTINDEGHQGLGNARTHSDSYMVKGAPVADVDYPSHSFDASYPNGTGSGISGAYMPDNIDHPFLYSRYYPYTPTEDRPTSIAAGHGNLGNAYRFVKAKKNSIVFNRPMWPTPWGVETVGGNLNVKSDQDALFSGGMWLRFTSMPTVGDYWSVFGFINEFWNVTHEKAWAIELYNNAGSYEIQLQYMDYVTETQQPPLVVPFSVPVNTWFWLDWYHDPVADQLGIALNNGSFVTASLSGGFMDWHNYSQQSYRGYYGAFGQYQGTYPNLGDHYPDMDFTSVYWYNYKKLSTAERNILYGSGNGYTHPAISPYPHI